MDLMDLLDPIISSLSLSRRLKKKKNYFMSAEAMSLLKSPDLQTDEESNDKVSDND